MTIIVYKEKMATELGKYLYDQLVKISDNNDFLLGVLLLVKGDERKKKLLKIMSENKNKLCEQYVLLKAVAIRQGIL